MMRATAGRTPCEKRIILYLRMSQLCKCVQYAYWSKDLPGLACTDSVQFQKKIPKISHHGSLSPKYKELGHFTLLFGRGRQKKNAPRFKTHVHSHCSVHWTFCLVSLASPSPLWFAQTPYCSVRDWTRFLRHRLKNIRIHPSTRYRIRCGYIFFHFGERIYFFPDSLSNSPDTCGR